MTYKELYESAADKLEKSKITLGEFEKMIEPLNAEIDTDSDTISRQAAIDALTEYGNGRAVFISVGEAIIRIEQLPPAQPEPLQPWEVLAAQAVLSQPKLGKWIYHIDDLFPAKSTKECNQCHAEQPLTCDDEFCPHCGAKMGVTT